MDTNIPYLKNIAEYGLLGILLVLSLLGNWYFIKIIQHLNDQRVQDAKEISAKILEPLNIIKSNGELLISLFQKFLSSSKT